MHKINSFGARIWIFILVPENETRALKRALFESKNQNNQIEIVHAYNYKFFQSIKYNIIF